jgi:hypothetical protein
MYLPQYHESGFVDALVMIGYIIVLCFISAETWVRNFFKKLFHHKKH